MLGSVLFLTALLSTLPINGNPLRDRDIDSIINLLQNRVEVDKTSEESSSASGGDDVHSLAEHKLKTMDVIDLIQQANKEKNRVQNDNHRQRYKANPTAVNLFYQNRQNIPNKNEKGNYGLKEQLTEQLLQKERKPLKKTIIQHLTPNRLLNSIQYKYNDALEQIGGLNEYSKIYVILDPDTLQDSRNANDYSNLVSSILSQTFSAIEKSRQDRNKGLRYKGFMVKDGARRFKRNSKERHDGDMEDEYRPKRPRSEYGGGGGGGRTAIPYIRHRGGDVYERDH